MPEVEGGWRPEGGAHGWIPYEGPRTRFQRSMREGVAETDREKLFDHITRPVREDDAQAFAVMDATTKYSDLPADVKRYRDDIFDDKYKRLNEDDLSRTITAHIAQGRLLVHPPTAEPDPDRPRGGAPADVSRLVPFRGSAVRRLPADRERRPAFGCKTPRQSGGGVTGSGWKGSLHHPV